MKQNAVSFFLVLIVILISGLSCNNKQDTEDDKPLVIRAGYLAHPGYLPLFCADYKGYLNNKQIQIEMVRFETSPAMVSAFNNNNIQIAPLASASALSLESLDSGKFKVFALSSETVENYLTAIVYLPSKLKGIKAVNDLKAKKIGVFPGPAARVLFTLVFEKFGLKPGKDVVFQELAPPLHLQALANGQVDALATYEPIATQAVIELGAVKLLPAAVETAVLTPTQGGSWLVSSSLLEASPEKVKYVVEAINKGIDFISSNSDSIPNILAKYASLKLEVAKQTPIVTYSKLSDINIDAYQKYADIMFDNGVISKKINVKGLLLDPNKYNLTKR